MGRYSVSKSRHREPSASDRSLMQITDDGPYRDLETVEAHAARFVQQVPCEATTKYVAPNRSRSASREPDALRRLLGTTWASLYRSDWRRQPTNNPRGWNSTLEQRYTCRHAQQPKSGPNSYTAGPNQAACPGRPWSAPKPDHREHRPASVGCRIRSEDYGAERRATRRLWSCPIHLSSGKVSVREAQPICVSASEQVAGCSHC